MTESPVLITTTRVQMTLTSMYDLTSFTCITPIQSTLTLKDACTETITTTTTISSIVGSPLSCDYSTVLAQTSTITVYFEPPSFTVTVPVATVTCRRIAPYTTTKTTPDDCSTTAIIVSTSYIVRSNLYSETVTYTSITTLTNTATLCQTLSSCYNSTIFIPVPTNTICPDMSSLVTLPTTVAIENNN